MELPFRRRFQRFFDQDFSDVHVWETPAVARLRAAAFTDGHDIYIAPAAVRSTLLLAHELAHIVQRRRGRLPEEVPCRGMALYDSALEDEAEASAIRFEAFLHGRSPARSPSSRASLRLTLRLPFEWLGEGAVVQCGRVDLTRAAFDRLPTNDLWVKVATGYYRVAKGDLQWAGLALTHRQWGAVQELHDSNPLMGHPPQKPAPAPPPPPLPEGPLVREKPLKEYFISQMAGDAAAAAAKIPQADCQRWDCAKKNLKGMGIGNPEVVFNAIVGDLTIKDFKELEAGRMAMINRFWDAIVEWKTAEKTLQEMFEPGSGDRWSKLSSTHRPWAFRKYGIAFRCENAGDLERIRSDGFAPLYTAPALAARLDPPHYVEDTVMAVKTAAGQMAIWKANKDGVGQTAICVSRGIKGATKFPALGHVGDVVLCAVKVGNLLGFDLEAWQREKVDKTAVWRPGEKMYPKIPKENLIGYVPLRKSGLIGNSRWRIRVLNQAWTFLGGSPEEQQYITGELADLQPLRDMEIATHDYDFWSA